MPENQNNEIQMDRKREYKILLEKMLASPHLILKYAKGQKTTWGDRMTFQQAFIQIDTRIRELNKELGQ